MARSITSSLTSAVSRHSAPRLGLAHYAALIGIGALLAFVHQAWDFHLGLPGHYGVIWMAGVMLARQWSPARWAATGTVIGYIGGTAILTHGSQHGLLQTPIYGLCTLAVDGVWLLAATRLRNIGLAGLLGGCAFLLKPLATVVLAGGLDLHFGALRFGSLLPLLTHFSFGAVGAVIGTLLYKSGSARR